MVPEEDSISAILYSFYQCFILFGFCQRPAKGPKSPNKVLVRCLFRDSCFLGAPEFRDSPVANKRRKRASDSPPFVSLPDQFRPSCWVSKLASSLILVSSRSAQCAKQFVCP